ncbi:methyltransferase domain-containing protein [Candidatus Woesearchaeota archaeon]|nr:MAG: methyltransferase domain-containing protein [Candidatus Woesearchaeota archaeon]
MGVVPKEALKGPDGTVVDVEGGGRFVVLSPGFEDVKDVFERSAQKVLAKDLGVVVAKTGMEKGWRVLDAGTGSGVAALFFARFAKSVVSYDVVAERSRLAEKNAEMIGVTNVLFKTGDVFEGVEERGVDLFFLDVPEPHRALVSARAALRPGGFLVVYTPHILQALSVVRSAGSGEWLYEGTFEVIEREWLVDERRLRPHSGLLHTAFLTFLRKLF